MKIAIATSSLPPGSGISVYVNELSNGFIKLGHNVMVFVTNTVDYSSETFNYPVHISVIPKKAADEFTCIEEFYDAVMHFNPDVLLINDCIYASDILPSLPSKCVRISIVHGYRERFGFDGHRLITKAAIHNNEYLDWVVGTSNSICSGLSRKYGINSKMIKLIYNGVEQFKPNASITKNIVDENKKVIVFAGGLNPTKGYDVFFKAVKILSKSNYKDWRVVWFGGKATPPKELKNSGLLGQYIDWKGVVPLKTLQEILYKSQILAMPSRAEACPMLLMDALSLGLVPVVSDCPSAMKEIVNEAKCGLVSKVGDYNELANCFIDLLSKPECFNEMSIRSFEYFENNLTIDQTCNKLLSIIVTRSSDINFSQHQFPFGKIHPSHRRVYKYSKWNPVGIYERFRLINGILPSIIKY